MGDSGVGKSSLLLRFTTDSFDESTSPTIGRHALQQNRFSGLRYGLKTTKEDFLCRSGFQTEVFHSARPAHKANHLGYSWARTIPVSVYRNILVLSVLPVFIFVEYKYFLLIVNVHCFRTLTSSYYRGAQAIIFGEL